MVAGNMQHQTGRFYSRAVRVAGLGFPAAPQINMEPNTGDRRVDGRQPDRRARPEGVHAAEQSLRFDVFLDALNLTNSDQYRVGRLSRSARSIGVRRRRRASSRRAGCSLARRSAGKGGERPNENFYEQVASRPVSALIFGLSTSAFAGDLAAEYCQSRAAGGNSHAEKRQSKGTRKPLCGRARRCSSAG